MLPACLRAQNIPGGNVFDKRFMGSYGFLSGLEPEVSDEEKQALRDILPLVRNNPRAAIPQLQPLVTGQSSAALDFLLANLHYQTGNISSAERYYRSAIRKYPDYRRAYKNLSLLLVQRNALSEAKETLSRSLELGDTEGRTFGLLGYIFLDEEDYHAAEVAYRQAMMRETDVLDWRRGLVRTLVAQEKHKEAVAMLNTLLRESPGDKQYWVLQANSFLALDEPLRAAENLEIIQQLGLADAQTLFLLGDIYMRLGREALALPAYVAALENGGGQRPDAALRAARILVNSGAHGEATEYIQRFREAVGQLEIGKEVEILLLESRIDRAANAVEPALEKLRKAVELAPVNGEAIIELARLLSLNNQVERALIRLDQAKRIEGARAEALSLHGQILVRQGKYREAARLLEESLALEPNAALRNYVDQVRQAAGLR